MYVLSKNKVGSWCESQSFNLDSEQVVLKSENPGSDVMSSVKGDLDPMRVLRDLAFFAAGGNGRDWNEG